MTGLPLFETLVGSIPFLFVAGFIYYLVEKKKNPARAATIVADATGVEAVLKNFVSEIKGIFGQHAATVAAAVAAIPAPVAAAPAPAPSAAPAPLTYVNTALGTAAVAAAPVKASDSKTDVAPAMTAADRDAKAFEIGPGITEDLSNISQVTGDTDVMRYASDIIYRQVDHPEESITTSIAFVKAQRGGNSGAGAALPIPTSGPIAAGAAIANGLPPVEKARYFQDHPELAPYANTLFPNPADLNNYVGRSSGSVSSATWDAAAGRYRMPDGRLLGDVPPAELGLG